MTEFTYEYPKEIELENGDIIRLEESDMKDERFLAIIIPAEETRSFASYLHDHGFTDAQPSWFQGEKYGLSRIVNDPWELHIRIFENGFLFPHIEIRRDFTQHLNDKYVWPVYFEAMEYVYSFTDKYDLLYLKTNKRVIRIVTKTSVKLTPPSKLTEWKPLVYFGIGVVAGALTAYGVFKLKEYLDRENEG
jgi:hypothetical protein